MDLLKPLQRIALMLLAIPPTTCDSERNFSNWGHVWSKKRASLAASRVHKLVYIFYNTRALNRKEVGPSDTAAFMQWLDALEPEPEQEEQEVEVVEAESEGQQ